MIYLSQLSFFILLFFSYMGSSLTPGRLPNGKLKTFISSIPPSKDLHKINYSQASLITKNWLQNIVVASVQREKNKLEKTKKGDQAETVKQNFAVKNSEKLSNFKYM